MAILDLYEKSKTTTSAAGASTKNTETYQELILKEGSIIIGQIGSGTNASSLEKTSGVPSYTEKIFNENK